MDFSVLLAQLGSEYPTFWEAILQVPKAMWWFYSTSFYWAPIVLPVMFWRVWIKYVRTQFIAAQEYVLLEIRIPQEITKSPAAMQAVLESIWPRGGESTFIDRLWYGKVRMWYSFELASKEGQVHMYIWTRKVFQRWMERSFYAHYPEIELVPVTDYAITFPFSLETHNMYGVDYSLGDSVGVPIRTYSDYGLDQTQPKEEQKIDPITQVLEFLGSMGKGEHFWIQILCRAHRREDITWGDTYTKKTYTELASAKIAKIRANPEETVVFPDGGTGKQLSDKQKEMIKAITRNMQKSQVYDVGIRALYLAEHEYFDGTNISQMQSLWQPFGLPGFNSIKSIGNRWQNLFDYPWQDFNGMRENRIKVKHIDAYRLRSWFHPPYRFKPFMLTTEELATIFHIPGSVAQTPTLQRIESSRASAPSNLPV